MSEGSEEPRFITDRWFSKKQAEFLFKVLKQDVTHLERHFRKDVDDVVWLEWAAKQGMVALTQDLSIAKSVGELEDVKRFKNIVFLFDVNNHSRWDRHEVLVRSWKHVKALARKTRSGPVVYRVGPKGLTNSDVERNRLKI